MLRYADGATLEQISAQVEVSVTSLSKWKTSTLDPKSNVDEWEKARAQKRSNHQRLRDLFERELQYVEAQAQGSLSASSMDALTKLGALVKRWDDVERARTALESPVAVEIDRPALFLETLEWLGKKLRETDPEGLKVLARNFDDLIEAFKNDHA